MEIGLALQKEFKEAGFVSQFPSIELAAERLGAVGNDAVESLLTGKG